MPGAVTGCVVDDHLERPDRQNFSIRHKVIRVWELIKLKTALKGFSTVFP
jgi:hypothetical protein